MPSCATEIPEAIPSATHVPGRSQVHSMSSAKGGLGPQLHAHVRHRPDLVGLRQDKPNRLIFESVLADQLIRRRRKLHIANEGVTFLIEGHGAIGKGPCSCQIRLKILSALAPTRYKEMPRCGAICCQDYIDFGAQSQKVDRTSGG